MGIIVVTVMLHSTYQILPGLTHLRRPAQLEEMRKNEDPRLSFSTPEFKEAQRIFTDNFKVNHGFTPGRHTKTHKPLCQCHVAAGVMQWIELAQPRHAARRKILADRSSGRS